MATPELMAYHDTEYGFPVGDDAALFERLVLEMFQAGLSWRTILAKRPAFFSAFRGFIPARVAAFGSRDLARLLDDRGIVRNRRKIEAAIHNARVVCTLIETHGSLVRFVRTLPLDDRTATVKTMRATFQFMGPLVVEEFLMSTGFWPVRHEPSCFLAG